MDKSLIDCKNCELKDIDKNLTLTYKTIADFTRDIEFCRDKNGKCIYVNPAFERLLGYSAKDYKQGKISIYDFVHPDDSHIPKEYMSRLFSLENFDDIEIRLIKKDNSIMFASCSSQPIVDEQGTYLGRRTSIRDITQRKNAERKIEAKEKKFREIFNKSNDAIFLYKIKEDGYPGKFVEVNQIARDYLGYSKEEFLQMSPLDIKEPKDVEKLPEIIQEIDREGSVLFETNLIAKDGSQIPMEISSHIISMNGKQYGHSIARNITERKKVEQQLRKLSTAIKQSPSIIVITDIDGNIEYVNPKFSKLTGYNQDEVVGKNPNILKSGQLNDALYTKLWETITSGNEWYGQFLNKKKNGELYWESAAISPIFDDHGNIINYFKVAEDITKRKKAEKQLIRSIIETEFFLNATTDGVWEWNFKTNKLFFSDRYYTMLGYTPHEFKPTYENWLKRIHPDDVNHAKKVAENYLSKKPDFYENEFRFRTKSGDYKWIRARAKVVKRDENGNAIRLIGSHEDITLKKMQEQKIIQTKNKLSEIIDSAPRIIVLIDEDYKIELWNKETEKITGLSRKKAIGKSLLTLPIFDNADIVRDSVKKLFEDNEVTKSLITIKDKDSRKRLIQPSYNIITRKDKKGILIFGNDVTEDAEKHGKIISGQGYFFQSEDNKEAIPALRFLLHSDKQGLFISRLKDEQLLHAEGLTKCTYLNLNSLELNQSQNNKDSLIDMVDQKVKEFCEHNPTGIIYFDRLDYLTYHHSFDDSLKLLYRIHEYIVYYNCILIVRINPGLLSSKQITAIREELHPLPSRDIAEIELEDKLFSILLFVNEKQENNCIVSFKMIKKEFSIVDVTVKKRLDALEDLGLIFIKQKGRMKTVHITKKGKHLLAKREII